MPNTRKKKPPIDAPADGWMSIATAARALKVAYNTVCAMALRGELESQTVAGRVFVNANSVERWLADHEATRRVG